MTKMAEAERRRRVLDMMLSMHSRLRDSYGERARGLDIGLLVGSAVLTSTAFGDEVLRQWVDIPEHVLRVGTGTVAVVLVALSIVGLRVDWKRAEGLHARAVEELATLKALSRTDGQNEDEFILQYDVVMQRIPAVPDKRFAALKAYHLRKVALSRSLDSAPFAPLWLHRWRLMVRDSNRVVVGEEEPVHQLPPGLPKK